MFLSKAKYYILFLGIMMVIESNSISQKNSYDTLRLAAWISPEGDTLALSYLPIVEMQTHKILTREERKRKEEWTRLRKSVYITYPYAKAASKIMNEINTRLVGVSDRKQRKLIIKSREKELKKEFTDKLKNMYIQDGKVLMKLIYRETNNSCYEIIEEYKGSFNAVLYQTIAIIVGTNLKQNYNAKGADKDLELIVKDVAKMYGDSY